ncbi:MAG: electron transfer flavoprotein alpha subunit [Polaribacter sp.]|jgi:electron transfer flavoprotein alpha subunit
MILIFAESTKGKFKKSILEAVTYGAKLGKAMGKECAAIVLGAADNAGGLGTYGANKVYQVNGDFANFDSQVYSQVISNAAKQLGAEVVLLSSTSNGKSLFGRIAVRLEAGAVSNVNALPDVSNGFKVKKSVFSGKAVAEYDVNSPVKVLSLMGNAIPPEAMGAAVAIETLDIEVPASKIRVKEVKTVEGTVPLPEAELVVSAGRGMKGPENWGIIEELANILGATTACSRPVADTGWRPHHEHVGQTGVAIRPNLYFAIGISGAIQHLAGVNNSKVIVVINKDPEAPFFKAANYGVCADLFDVVPKLNAAMKKFKEAG